jgi:Protein of unknown function (DUF3500)
MSASRPQRLPGERTSRIRSARTLTTALACAVLLALLVYFSRDSTGDDQVVANAVAKANAFLEALDSPERERALLDFDSAKKPSWSNLPVTMVPRNGVRMGELNQRQRSAALDALAAVLSKEGFQKVVDIMNGDDQLAQEGRGNRMRFGSDNYYLALFGKPSATTAWMLQFGGHHLGINVTIVGKERVLTPTHTGAQPDSFTRNEKTVRPLGAENDLAFKLVNMLDAAQQKQAVLGNKPKDLLLGPGRDEQSLPQPGGLKCASLNDNQRATLMELIGAWVEILPNEAATKRMAALKAQLDETYFAWYGPTTNGSAAYYRIQGPTLWIEYAPQRGIHHIHTIIRDPSNDYARKLTRS